jgi:hypothetical protein
MSIMHKLGAGKLTQTAAVLGLAAAMFAAIPAAADGHMPGNMGMGSEMGMPQSAEKPSPEPMGGMESPPMEQMPSSDAMADTSSDAMPEPLPAFAGAPELYHMGATGFFLDHPEHIALSPQQRKALETIKASTQKDQLRYQQQIAAVENDVWSLTGMEEPDAAAIEQKIREIEALRTKQRMAFIEAVGKAATTLSISQRKQLVGQAAPEMAAATDSAANKKGK